MRTETDLETNGVPCGDAPDAPAPDRTKRPWRRPVVTPLGSLRRLVQGMGKMGSHVDGEGRGKRGVG